MRLIFYSLAVMFCFGFSALAETQSERLARLTSDDFARQSQKLLVTGDRPGAIIMALRGLPNEPSQADIDVYPQAHGALLEAMVSRALRLPLLVESYAPVDPTGRRVATIGALPLDAQRPTHGEPLKLWDAQTGRLIAQPLPLSSTTSDGVGPPSPAFSPDGRFLAMVANQTGDVVVFSATDGSELWRQRPYRTNSISLGLTFSPDSSRLMTTGGAPGNSAGSSVDVWDVATGALIVSDRGDLGCLYVPITGGRGSKMHFLRSGYQEFCGGQRMVVRVDAAGIQDVLDLRSLNNLFLSSLGRLDDSGTKLLMATEELGSVVVGMDGSMHANLPPAILGSTFMEFARGATALVSPREHSGGVAGGIVLFDFQGTRLDPMVEDGLRYTHGVYTPSGVRIGWHDETGRKTYLGADLPRGKALYDYVWANLPEHVRQTVQADRVQRP